MDLPGIGRFTMDPAAVLPQESDKALQTPATGIHFTNLTVNQPDDELINFLHVHTGKMKPLAAADLDFFLTTGKQLLNIGKVFYLEGIGTLIKNMEGKLDFTPGEYATSRLDEPSVPRKREKTPDRHVVAEEAPERSDDDQPRSSNSLRQVVLLAGIVAGLVVIGWGGYTLYKKNTVPEPPVETAVATPVTDTARTDPGTKDSAAQKYVVARKDSAANKEASVPATVKPAATSAAPANGPVSNIIDPDGTPYKFVILETTHKGHALRRYNQLLGFQLNIKMDQKDSAYFKLYFPITVVSRDTAHVRDSLADVYAAHVTIER